MKIRTSVPTLLVAVALLCVVRTTVFAQEDEDNTQILDDDYTPDEVEVEVEDEVQDRVDSAVVTLDDSNFEHLTQVSTGATTGDWLVQFYVPWCDHCKTLQPIWEEVASELRDEAVLGRVDMVANRLTKERFQINSYPTIKYFRKGEMYAFKGSRTKEELVRFVRSGWQEGTVESVPRPYSFLETQLQWLTLARVIVGKKLDFAKKDISRGKYWTPHTMVVATMAAAALMFLTIIVYLLVPSSKAKGARKVKTEKAD